MNADLEGHGAGFHEGLLDLASGMPQHAARATPLPAASEPSHLLALLCSPTALQNTPHISHTATYCWTEYTIDLKLPQHYKEQDISATAFMLPEHTVDHH